MADVALAAPALARLVAEEHRGAALLLLRLTAVMLILYGAHFWQLQVPLRILCGAMLVFPRVAQSAWVWLAVALTLMLDNAANWFQIDNHKFLMTYWVVACFFATSTSDSERVLVPNATLLLGLVFLFATAWKLLAGQYVNGAFLHYKFLTDSRVSVVASWVAGLDLETIRANRGLRELLQTYPSDGLTASLTSTARLRYATLVLSYWTLLIEGSLAFLFLIPAGPLVRAVRSALLLVFIATTYFVLPVPGFAFILAIPGLAQVEPSSRWARNLFLASFVLIELTHVPWQTLGDELIR